MEKFDVNFIDAKGKEKNREVKNGVVSIFKFLSSMPEDGILCAEHTGAYGDLLVYLCNQAEIPIALIPGYTIKHSLGLSQIFMYKSYPSPSFLRSAITHRYTDINT